MPSWIDIPSRVLASDSGVPAQLHGAREKPVGFFAGLGRLWGSACCFDPAVGLLQPFLMRARHHFNVRLGAVVGVGGRISRDSCTWPWPRGILDAFLLAALDGEPPLRRKCALPRL